MRNFFRWALGVAVAGGAVVVVVGDVAQACFMRSPQPVQVSNDTIEVEIHDQVAVKKYDCRFFNPNPQAVVGGTCYMEVEPGAQVDNMSLTVDGQQTQAELLDASRAKKVFQDILRQGGSPALLEFYGNQLIQSQVPHVPPNGSVTIKLQYTTILKSENGLFRLSMLNTNPKALLQPLKKAAVRISIKSTQGIKNLYSPTHPIRIHESKDFDVVAAWEQENYLPKTPFVFYYSLSDEQIGLNLLAHREPGDPPGYFMLMVSPNVSPTANIGAQVVPKDVLLCADTSGSMIQNGKMDQARAALRHCVNRLNPKDRFNIVSFSTEARLMSEELLSYTEQTRDRALRHIDGLVARGGTAIEDALDLALGQFRRDARLKMIVFMTDGEPSIGETDPDKLLKIVQQKNDKGARIFVFGVGYDVNTKFLDLLARENKGEADYVVPEEKIEGKIGPFFEKVSSPVLTDVKVKIAGVEVEDVYPKRVADLFKGGQIVVFGRYHKPGTADVTVTGRVNGEERSTTVPVQFPERATRSDFVPRLWAGRKVAFLLAELKKNGENKEVIDEVVKLAKRFGIVTPYTSYLVVHDQVRAPMTAPAPAAAVAGRFRIGDQAGWGGHAEERLRADFVRDARELAALESRQDAFALWEAADERFQTEGKSRRAMDVMRYIGSKTFYLSGGAWFDSTYDPEKHEKALKRVKIRSDEYYDLLTEKEGLSKFMSLSQVVVNFDGTWYHFSQ